VVGQDDAETEVVIYEDFLCPFCGQLESALGDQLDTAIEQGDVRVEYRALNFLSQLGDYSLRTANAFAAVSETAGPEAAKEFHDLVFAEQPPESGPFPDDGFLVDKAVEAGADENDVRPLIEDLGFEGWVEDGTEAASRDGIRSTPTVLINGEQAAGQSPDQIAQEVFAAIG
jgi:protein-disulfide isomerase